MNKWTSKDIADLVGITAIVASLIFVGLQMRQTHDIALAGHYQARAEATMEMYLTLLELEYSPPDPRLAQTDASPRDFAYTNWAITALDSHHYQYTAGFLSEDAWTSFVRGYRPIVESCGFQSIFEVRKLLLRTEFVQFIESQYEMCP